MNNLWNDLANCLLFKQLLDLLKLVLVFKFNLIFLLKIWLENKRNLSLKSLPILDWLDISKTYIQQQLFCY